MFVIVDYAKYHRKLDPETIVATNERPIIAHCDDLNFYYLKYHKNVGSASRLFNEYLIASILPYWDLNFCEYALVNVLPQHLPDNLGINKAYFNVPCFGIKKLPDCLDLTENNVEILKRGNNKKKLKRDILIIAFLDMFICNEDRHLGNLNILSQRVDKEYILYPIV